MERPGARLIAALAIALITESSARASLLLLDGPQQGTHTANLVVNGSFENGHPFGSGAVNYVHWATGSTIDSVVVPPGWTSSVAAQTYASWGSDLQGTVYTTRFSDVLPDGQLGVWFGNGSAVPDQEPTFLPTGEVSFPATPNIFTEFGQPARLSQTINTVANPAEKYLLSFWASGELAGDPRTTFQEGIFGLKITNVLPGDPIQFLTTPAGGAFTGFVNSHRYELKFAPLDPSLPVTVEFISWGNMDLSAFSRNPGPALVLDDVIVNAINPIPEPSSLALAGLALLGLRRRSRV